jgi:hypothetical protein
MIKVKGRMIVYGMEIDGNAIEGITIGSMGTPLTYLLGFPPIDALARADHSSGMIQVQAHTL